MSLRFKIIYFTLLFTVSAGIFLFPNYTSAVEYNSCCVCINVDTTGEGSSYNTLPKDTEGNLITDATMCASKSGFGTSCSIGKMKECGEIIVETTKLGDEFGGFKDVVLGVAIPSLQFSAPPSEVDSEGNIYISWIGEYLSAVYNFAVLAISIIGIVMLIMMGIKIITSGGGPAKADAYKRISQIVIGLFIAWGSYAILFAINPDLTVFKSLKIAFIEPMKIEIMADDDYKSLTGKSPGVTPELLAMAVVAGKNAGITDECIMKTIVSKESGGNPGAIGHDENFNRTNHIVWSRRKFLLSGIKYSGSTFSPVASDKSSYKTSMNASDIKNDDKFDASKPPDYGLDWRFSHGIGLGQMTINPDESSKGFNSCMTTRDDGKEERGIKKGGSCIGISKLLAPETALEQSAKLFKSNLDCAASIGLTGEYQFRGALFAYAAGCGALKKLSNPQETLQNHLTVTRAMGYYQACQKNAKALPESNPEQSPVATSEDESMQ